LTIFDATAYRQLVSQWSPRGRCSN